MNNISRRNLLKAMGIGTAATLVAITLKPTRTFGCEEKVPTLTSSVGTNHGHEFILTLNELITNGPKIYSIKGKSGHNHNINITAEALAALNTAKVVEIVSSNDFGHAHVVKLEIL